MTNLDAQVTTRYEFGGTVRGADGFEIDVLADDSFRSWRQIVRWNWHFKHWGALRMNARDLFSKVLWKKVSKWQLS